MIVSKFGGTSMADATCMARSADLAKRQKSKLVVVSATSGTTNKLIELGHMAEAQSWEKCQQALEIISQRHLQIAKDLQLTQTSLQGLLEMLAELKSLVYGIHLLKDCSPKAMDALMSFGERLSSELFVTALEKSYGSSLKSGLIQLLDARKFILTDDQFGKARPLISRIREICQRLLSQSDSKTIFVTQGFIGGTEAGSCTTLGRGGSDYSAALFAEAFEAQILEIWTDVPGIATTDPRMVPEAKAIPEISFTEASELATFGAKVLHPATLAPALRKNIPVFVGSSFDPELQGTWVRMKVESQPLVRALAVRKKQVLVTLTTPEMLHSHGFLFKVFKVFNEHKISIDAITTSEISVAMTLDDSALLNKNLIGELEQFADVQVEEGLSLVSLIGNNINHTPGLGKKIFEALENINVRMICHGASKHNFCFLVSEDKAELAVKKLHQGFCQ